MYVPVCISLGRRSQAFIIVPKYFMTLPPPPPKNAKNSGLALHELTLKGFQSRPAYVDRQCQINPDPCHRSALTHTVPAFALPSSLIPKRITLYQPQPSHQLTLMQADQRCLDYFMFEILTGFSFLSKQIVPYFGVMFGTFEFCKRICLYQNGYIVSPLSYQLTPGVDQSLKPQELREFKKFFKTRQLKSKKPTL